MNEKVTEEHFPIGDVKPSTIVKIMLCLFIGCLSTFFAEVLSGSAPLWYLDLSGYILILPLYMLHLLLLLNLAMRSKRTSIPQLYLWGIFFALYESWITKVLWFAYPNAQSAQFGLFFGIAWGEFIMLVFFFHPIFSFIIPILVFQLFAISNQSESDDLKTIIFPSHVKFMIKNKKVAFFIILAILLSVCFIPISLGFNIFAVFLATVGNIIIILFLYFLCKVVTKNKREVFSIYSLRLGKLGLTLVIISIIVLYVFTFFFLLPERLPTTFIPYLIIICFYLFIISMIIVSKPVNEINIDINNSEKILKIRELILCLGIWAFIAIIMCFTPVLASVVGVLTYLTMMVVGCIIFGLILYSTIKERIINK